MQSPRRLVLTSLVACVAGSAELDVSALERSPKLQKRGIVPPQLVLIATNRYSNQALGLDATISAKPGSLEDVRLVFISFRLTNNSDSILDSQMRSWKLFIDGQEADLGGPLWMGATPTGEYDKVHPGQIITFNKALSSRRYFSEPRDYQVYWKSAAFRSNVVTIKGQMTSNRISP